MFATRELDFEVFVPTEDPLGFVVDFVSTWVPEIFEFFFGEFLFFFSGEVFSGVICCFFFVLDFFVGVGG